jgi:YD repeat-containing protein
VTLAYIGGLLSSITLPDGEVWRLTYAGANLAAIFDPLHTGSTPWRSFAYAADSQGGIRLLTEARDEAGALLEDTLTTPPTGARRRSRRAAKTR